MLGITGKPVDRTTLFVWCIFGLCLLDVVFIFGISMLRMNSDNTSLIASVLGVTLPVITALLAGTVQQVHVAVNSRLTELVELTAKASHAEGRLDERERKTIKQR